MVPFVFYAYSSFLRSDVYASGFGEHAAGGIEHGPLQAKARRRRQGAGAEPLLRGGWDG